MSATEEFYRLESRERDEELATMIASKLLAAQRAQQSADNVAAAAPIRRADFDRLSPAEKMIVARSRKIID